MHDFVKQALHKLRTEATTDEMRRAADDVLGGRKSLYNLFADRGFHGVDPRPGLPRTRPDGRADDRRGPRSPGWRARRRGRAERRLNVFTARVI
ncbi:hypothetical protein [Nocardioides sp. B-3]|uniref:hypothetical protein n=1 Tax=Nocardioides sp. B-3 TaxID=2895565 RepID=UPI0021525130|nr:hypothetical protein [Nocardioides sp. B-3]UUZ60706.1 hypothetical protein LP418_07835 [Nocardioides sp. B-3]